MSNTRNLLAAAIIAATFSLAVEAESDHRSDDHHQQHDHATESDHDQHDHGGEHEEGHDDNQGEASAHDEGDHSGYDGHEGKHEEGRDGEGDHGDEEGHDAHGDEDEHADEGAHGAHAGHGNEGGDGVALSAEQQALANIQVSTLMPQMLNSRIYAPGEIKVNGYTSYIVSPRVDSVVLRRHVAMGDHVEKGQQLVTLFSEEVSKAQADFLVDTAEWQRVKSLGRKAVGAKRYIRTETDFDAAYSRLLAFGLSDAAIANLSNKNANSAHRLGEYSLTAVTNGAVLSDDFHQGQRVEAGTALMSLADERELWVEARLSQQTKLILSLGAEVKVKVGDDWFVAVVAQKSHAIDPVTRTRVVRLLLDNASHRLHAGMFADVYFEIATERPVLAVPEAALMRSADGDWTVFVEIELGQFKAQEVERGRSLGEWREISGIKAGTKVVTEGAFFVSSQIAKGGFDPHNH